jgi:tetratricopeptide (TPR) repeat protein
VKPRAAEFHEALTFDFDALTTGAADLVMYWEKIAVPVHLAADVKAVTLSSIRNQLRDLQGYVVFSWMDAAEWLLEQKYELNQSLAWAQRAVQMNRMFGSLELQSRVLSAVGREDDARKVLREALAMATVQEFYTYARGLQLTGKKDEGLALLREVSTKTEDSWIVHLAKARVLSSEKKFADAAKEAQTALESSPAPNKPQIERLIDRLKKGEDINS